MQHYELPMDNTSPTYNILSQALVFLGLILIIIGGILSYPYVRSRLETLPRSNGNNPEPAPTETEAFLPLIDPPTSTPTPTTPTPNATAAPTDTLSPTETATPAPTPTPTPIPAPPTRIVIPEINVDAPVITVSQEPLQMEGQTYSIWKVPDQYAAGWHNTSATLGVPGNTVLNGHNTTNGEVFRDLYTLEAGDSLTIYSEDEAFEYTVDELLILPEAGQPLEVRLDNARYIMPTVDERVTLVTCHPYGSLRNRLIVIAKPAR